MNASIRRRSPIATTSPVATAAMLAIATLLAACGTTSTPRSGDGASRPSADASAAPSASTRPPRKGGGYYLDDGPGDNPPPDLDLLPDAVPRVEKYASGANRPYNVFGVDYVPDLSGAPYKQRGVGSWYGRKFHGQRTSNGEIYDMYAMTAAHPTLPIPSYALVTNLQNGRSVIVRVNDRGPFLHNRVMDLSYAAAHKLGYMTSGSGLIEVEMLLPRDIAAGRIPVTTNGLLATASMAGARVAASEAPGRPSAVTTATGAATAPAPSELSIEALTASVPTTPVGRPSLIAGSGTPANAAGGLSGAATIGSGALAAPGLPPAPTIVPEAASRSLPSTSIAATAVPSVGDSGPALVALPDRQPPASLPATATGAGYYLQLGAFRAKAGADSFASLVAREIDPALATRVQVSDAAGGLFRVRLGPYAARQEADNAAASLRAAIAQPVLVMPEAPRR